MSTSIAKKMHLLAGVTAHYGVMSSTMSHVIERLEIRNDQTNSRKYRACSGGDIRLDCCHAEMTWSDAIVVLHEATDESCALGSPLSNQQLLACTLQLHDTNALPLVALLHSVELQVTTAHDPGKLAKASLQLCEHLPVFRAYAELSQTLCDDQYCRPLHFSWWRHIH